MYILLVAHTCRYMHGTHPAKLGAAYGTWPSTRCKRRPSLEIFASWPLSTRFSEALQGMQGRDLRQGSRAFSSTSKSVKRRQGAAMCAHPESTSRLGSESFVCPFLLARRIPTPPNISSVRRLYSAGTVDSLRLPESPPCITSEVHR